ncbi:PEP-CTERM system histidine kinase PrsK, partial [bacterium]|nr:PEP-CTERM system histidine kinase PrsK [bacterium]
AGLVFVLACGSTALAALVRGLEGLWGENLSTSAALLDVLRCASWVAFLALVYRDSLPARSSTRAVRGLLLLAAFLTAAFMLGEFLGGERSADALPRVFFLAEAAVCLLLVGIGLMFIDALLRQASPEARWQVKYLCIGVGGILAYELFVASEAVLMNRLSPALLASRGAIGLAAALPLAVAGTRMRSWRVELYVSRRAAYQSTALLVIGFYLLASAAVAVLLRTWGGDWGAPFQITFLFGSFLALAALLLSETARAALKMSVRKYFGDLRYDYRDEWQRFVHLLSSPERGGSLAERSLHAVQSIVNSPDGAIFVREEGGSFVCAAQVRLPEALLEEPADSAFVRALEEHADAVAHLDAESGGVSWLPEWLRASPTPWIALPLRQRDALIGFIVLTRPKLSHSLNWEDEQLLRIVGRQVASYVAEERAVRALEDTRYLQELSRRLAFVAHDLRNLANELRLTIDNARKHMQNPEFQRDLLTTMEESVARMQRLLERISQEMWDAEPHEPERSDLVQLVARSVAARGSEKPAVRLDLGGERSIAVVGDADRLAALIGHLLRNATEAAGSAGRVDVRLRRGAQDVTFEVADDGPGMAPRILQDRLLHPAASSKSTGYGVGLYQCRRLASELGGRLEVESELKRGTVARVRLPVACAEKSAARG